MMISALRITKFAFQNFWRNFWLSMITVSMLTLTLLTVNVVLVLQTVTDQAVAAVQDRIEVSVYFKSETPDARVETAVAYLRGLPQVRDVGVVTADEALERFRARHASNADILQSLEEVGGNPFGPTLVVKAFSAADFTFIIDALDNPQFRDDIRDKDFTDYEQVIGRIRFATDRVQWFGYGLTAIFLAIAVLIIFNTVRMGIFIHREEIGIMKLVGASDGFVRAPFLVESVLFSLLALVIAGGITFPLLGFLEPKLDVFFGGVSTGLGQYFLKNGLMIFGLQFVALAVLNVLATALAMRKYLKV